MVGHRVRKIDDLAGQEPWRHLAKCRGMQWLFYTPHINCRCYPTCPDKITTVEAREREEQAKKVCATCPVMKPCLEYAVVNKESGDVWGGKTPNERSRLVGSRLRTG